MIATSAGHHCRFIAGFLDGPPRRAYRRRDRQCRSDEPDHCIGPDTRSSSGDCSVSDDFAEEVGAALSCENPSIATNILPPRT
jgi:hypothetical protein